MPSDNPSLTALLADDAWARALARRLVGDAATADDVVQDAWVAALRQPPARPGALRPWLAEVVRNAARQLRRAGGRRAARERAVAAAEALPATDRLVANAEARRRLVDAVLGLPEPFRETVLLRWFEHVSAADIARHSGVPAATVRWRLQRALDLLRERLDDECGGDRRAWVVALLPLVRPPVAAGALAVSLPIAALAALTGGSLLMKKVLLASAGCALVALGVWLAVPAPAPAAAVPAPGAPAPDAVAAAVPGASAGAEPAAPDATRREAVAASAERGPAPAAVTGRVVDPAGRPVAEARVVVDVRPRDAAEWGSGGWPRRAGDAVTGPDGRFAFELAAAAAAKHWLDVDHDRFVRASGDLPELRPGASHDLGDVVLARGVRLRAEVRDETGRPVAGVVVQVETAWSDLSGRVREGSQFAVVSDEDGVVDSAETGLLLPGPCSFGVDERYELVEPRRIVLDAGVEVARPILVVRAKADAEAITGRVTLAGGGPAAGMEVGVMWRGRAAGVVRCDAGGRFELFRPDALDGSADPVVVRAAGGEGVLPAFSEPVRWGTGGLELECLDAAVLDLRVTDDAGRPVEEFGVALVWSADLAVGKEIVARGTHDGGRLELPMLGRTGEAALLVWPETGAALAPPVDVALRGEDRVRVDVVVPRVVPLRVAVRRSDGAPVAGVTVEVIRRWDREFTWATPVSRREVVLWNLRPNASPWPPRPYLIDGAETAADGSATLRCHAAPNGVALRITGAGVAPVVVDPVPPPGDEPLEVVVTAAAAIAGTVAPRDHAPWFRLDPARPARSAPGLVLRRPGDEVWLRSAEYDGFPIAADGTFRIEGITPGTWEVLLHWWRPIESKGTREHVHDTPLAVVTVAPGETAELDLDLGDAIPGRLAGRVALGGAGAALADLRLTARRFEDGREVVASIDGLRTDEDGRFEAGGLLPGEYRIDVKDHVSGAWWSSSQWVRVAAATRSEHVFAAGGRAVAIHLRGPGGVALAHRPLTVLHEELRRVWTLTADGDGVARVAAAPAGTLRLLLHGARGGPDPVATWAVASRRAGTALDPIEVPPGTGELEFERGPR